MAKKTKTPKKTGGKKDKKGSSKKDSKPKPAKAGKPVPVKVKEEYPFTKSKVKFEKDGVTVKAPGKLKGVKKGMKLTKIGGKPAKGKAAALKKLTPKAKASKGFALVFAPAAAAAAKPDKKDKGSKTKTDEPAAEAEGEDEPADAGSSTKGSSKKGGGAMADMGRTKFTTWHMIFVAVFVIAMVYINIERVAGEMLKYKNPNLFKGCAGQNAGQMFTAKLSGNCGVSNQRETYRTAEPIVRDTAPAPPAPRQESIPANDNDLNDIFDLE